MLSNSPAIVDASTLINLAATDVLAEMLQVIAERCFVCRAVKGECLFIRSKDGTQLDPVEPAQWIEAGLIAECELSPQEEERFVSYAAAIDDGEAMSLAVAETRGFTFVSDDRKACRLAADAHVRTISTAAIVREWARSKSETEVAVVINAIEKRARFCPPETDPAYKWWAHHRGQ